MLPPEVVGLAYVAELCFFLFDECMQFLDGGLTVQRAQVRRLLFKFLIDELGLGLGQSSKLVAQSR